MKGRCSHQAPGLDQRLQQLAVVGLRRIASQVFCLWVGWAQLICMTSRSFSMRTVAALALGLSMYSPRRPADGVSRETVKGLASSPRNDPGLRRPLRILCYLSPSDTEHDEDGRLGNPCGAVRHLQLAARAIVLSTSYSHPYLRA
jgi:hypothetical protein